MLIPRDYGTALPVLTRFLLTKPFRMPGRILPQFVEMPDSSQFFVFSHTVDRQSFTRHAQDVRLAVAMGCAVEHVDAIAYAEDPSVRDAHMTPIGTNCRVCLRTNCDQRAHNAVIQSEPVDERRRGATRHAT